MWDFFVMGKPEHVDEMRNKLHKEFGIVEGFQLSKLLGVQYEWKYLSQEKVMW